MSKSKKKAHHEEHADESWLLPYSDLLTLLLALFIVMFAMGQVDKAKFQQLSEQFNVIFSGGSSTLEQNGNELVIDNPHQPETPPISNTQIEEDKLSQIKENLEAEIKKSGHSDKVKLTLDKEGLQISIQDVMLFNSGDADVLPDVSTLLLHMAKSLNSMDNRIVVVGHTDNLPIKSDKYRSNWDLSVIRAINVMSFLVDQGGMSPERFSVQGYGEYAPKFDNSTADGRSKNRRVEIYLIRNYPPTDAEKKPLSN